MTCPARVAEDHAERGSGTVLMVGVVAVVLVLVAALGSLAGAQRARGTAQAAADLAALAAAGQVAVPSGLAVVDLGDRDACALAAEVATRNGARLTACTLRGAGVVDVDTVVPAVVGTARAEARAGPAAARPDGGAG